MTWKQSVLIYLKSGVTHVMWNWNRVSIFLTVFQEKFIKKKNPRYLH